MTYLQVPLEAPPKKIKPETPVKPGSTESPTVAKKPVVPKPRDDHHHKPEVAVRHAVKVIAIERPAKAAEESMMSSDDNLSGDGSDVEEPLPPPAPKASARAPRVGVEVAALPVVDSEAVVVPEVKEGKVKTKVKKDKVKKKKKKVKVVKESSDSEFAVAMARAPLSDMSTDTVPSMLAPTPSTTLSTPSSSSLPSTQRFIPAQPGDDVYVQPVPSVPIEAAPAGPEPGLVSARQKRKMKRQLSKGNAVDFVSGDSEEPTPRPEHAVYSNSPPQRQKVRTVGRHTRVLNVKTAF